MCDSINTLLVRCAKHNILQLFFKLIRFDSQAFGLPSNDIKPFDMIAILERHKIFPKGNAIFDNMCW
jgi:hypothetical protein